MTDSAVGFLLNQLSSMLSEEYSLLGGLQRELQYIRDELGSMRAFLRDAEAKENTGPLDFELQEWIKQVREIAYDIEDAVDEFLLCSSHHKASGFYENVQKLYTSFKNLSDRRRISSKIRDIKYRVEDISARHQRYQKKYGGCGKDSIYIASGDISQHPFRAHALLVEEADLVGIDKPKSQIISQLLDNESHLKVMSVVGMGGLGKTTLVKRIYEDVKVRKAFNSHAWLTVSQTFQIGDGLKKLIQQLFKEVQQLAPVEVDSMDEDELRVFVKDFLKERRYVIVIDDVWSTDAWDSIKYALPDGDCGSRVLLTTRNADIAITSSRESHGYVHKLKPLSSQDSWALFCQKTFLECTCPPHLVDISHSILSKCEGLPLGILAISGLLALKDTSKLYEWETVFRSLGGELEGTGKLDRIRKILLLSYNELPYYLKSCLLYIGIFPEDYPVFPSKLVRLWVAEGFVQKKPGMTMIEVAQGYLNELINRSLVQVASTHPDGTLHLCRVHDLLHEMILAKCREYNILTVASTPYSRWPENVRRLAIHMFTYPQEPTRWLSLRSLIINRYAHPLSSSFLSRLLNGGPKLLKVLDVSGSQVTNIPEEVFKLLHLTFLNLADTKVEIVPKSIRKLQNLEHFSLARTKVKELPVDILELKKLIDLYVFGPKLPNSKGFKAPEDLGGLLSLQCLLFLKAYSEKVLMEIGKLTHLRVLGITKLKTRDGKALCSSLEKLTHLHELFIHASTQSEILDLEYPISSTLQFLQMLTLSGRLVEIPHWVRSLPSLTVLELCSSYLREDPLECLEDLPNLAQLTLDFAYVDNCLYFRAEKFQKLKRLVLRTLIRLRLVQVEKGAMPNLAELVMGDCRLLEDLPHGIQYLSKLRLLDLWFMPFKLICYLKNLDPDSDDYQKIAHITQICF